MDLLLAQVYDPKKHDVSDYYWSEKLDGMRAFYDHKTKTFYSRSKHVFQAPDFFKKGMPDVDLDGELWLGRNSFQKTGIIRTKVPNEKDWSFVKYMIFDVPNHPGTFEERLAFMKQLKLPEHVIVVPNNKFKTNNIMNEIFDILDEYEKMGAEGLMLRDPDSLYERKRSYSLLKVKSFFDDEAEVIGYEPGTGRLKGLMGSLKVVNTKGIHFKVGTGFTDEQRKNAPKIGSIITYKFTELTKAGVPRHPVFVAERVFE